MDKGLNIELRKDILEFALTLETNVSRLLVSYLNIDNENLKTLGHKNTSLSFKNKIDLLSDLDVLTKEEHSNLLLLMEFRNQFLHNIDSNSFLTAIQLLGPDRGKQLLKFNDVDSDSELEFKYNNSYRNLFLNCLQTIISKYEIKKQLIETRRKMITDVSDYLQYVIDKDAELLGIIFEKCVPDPNSDTKELTEYKVELSTMIANFTNSMTENEEFNQLKNKVKIDEIKIKQFFK
jgi:hypothetical protein